MTTTAAIRTAPAPPVRRGRPLWWADFTALSAAGLALGIALLGPRLLPDTDPLGVDPYALRLGAVSLALLAAAALSPRLRPALPVMVAVAAVVLPFVLWSALPWLLVRVSGDALGYRVTTFVQDAAYALATLAIVVAAARLARASWWRWPRLGMSWMSAGAALLTVLAMVLVFLAVPATLVGRIAVPLAALTRDLPLLGPAFMLQAVAQELAFRGALLRTLERAAPFWMANLGQALLFGLAHIAVQYEGPTDTIVPITVALGLALGWVTKRTGSLWPAIVAHAVLEVGQAYGVLPGLYGL
ncbi:MAG TPA: type II CAAX endopeptidase family protein [Candidatus Dormibacteraeota bacterium]